MKKTLCSILVVTTLSIAVPTWAGDKVSNSQTPVSAAPLGSALRKAGPQVSLVQGPSAASAQSGVRGMPRTGSDRIRKQGKGGGKTAMIIGLVTTLVGVATTVYVVKLTKKSIDEQKQ